MTPYEQDREMWETIARALIMIFRAIVKRYALNMKDPAG
jgi:hypothetical protein